MNNTSDIQKIYPLSHMQEGILFHSLLDGESTSYFEQIYFVINGELNIELFEKSLNMLIARYDIFRTNFVHEKVKQPVQVVFKEKTGKVYFEDLTNLNEKEKEGFLENFKVQERKSGFDLLKGLLVKLAVFKTENKKYKVIWSHHHILLDGWSMGIVIKELLDIYISLVEEKNIKFEEVIPYGEYIKWLQNKDKEEAERYWKEYLEDYEQTASIPKLTNTNKNDLYKNEEYAFKIDKKLTSDLTKFARNNQVTLNNVFQSIWGVVLQKYNNVDDVVFGAVVSGRPSEIPEIENMVGLFINTIPVRIKCSKNMRFIDLIGKVKETVILSEKHDYMPLAQIQANTSLKQSLLDHILAFENYPLDENMSNFGENPSSKFYISDIDAYEETNYNFNIVIETGNELTVKLGYNSCVYEKEFIMSIEGHLKKVMETIIKQPDIDIDNIEIITEDEKNRIMVDFNQTKANYPHKITIHQLFEQQVEKTPNNIAVVYEDKKLTYRELNERSNSVARILRNKGVKSDDIVGIMVERSIEMIVGILGILKSGAAYLPVDLIYPEDRIKYILEDSGTKILLTQKHLLNKVNFKGEIINLDEDDLYKGDVTNLKNINSPYDLAYVIYTSGTTGKPKGSMIEHRNIVRLMFNDKMQFDFKDTDVWTMFHSVCFDFSVWEMYGALLYGGTLVVIPKLVAQDAREYLKVLIKEKVTILNQTPPALYNLMNEDLSLNENSLNLRYVIFAGEAIKPIMLKDWRKKYPYAKLINMYGITETTVHVTYKEISDCDIELNINNIGKPIPTLTTYIMDKNQKLLPIGVAGELCICGDGLGRGYLHKPELTNEKFISNPYKPEERLYRSGDLARFLPDGNIECIGRIDHQVKIRGFRIELGEIESKLLKNEVVKDAIVIVRKNFEGDNYICAYICSDSTIEAADLREYLAKDLPNYMIPSYFIQLENIPLTTNGKVDRRALPDPIDSINSRVEIILPSNDTEEKLVKLWKEILQIKEISVKHNFFEIGGHSLKATVLVSRIQKEFNINIPLKKIFECPTIKELSEVIMSSDRKIYSEIKPMELTKEQMEALSAAYPTSSAQKRLYVLGELEGSSTTYNLPSAMMIEGDFDLNRFENSFNTLIKRHESLRTSFKVIDGCYLQIVHKEVDFKVELVEKPEEEVREIFENFVRHFDLSKAPLLRVKIVKISQDRHVMLFDMHHIITDGVSIDILINELTDEYQNKRLTDLKIQYKDYANWQNKMVESGVLKRQEEYWLNVFKEEIPVLNIPTDYPRPPIQSFSGERLVFNTDKELMKNLNKLAVSTGVTMYMVLLAAYNVLLAKYTSQDDIIIGSAIAGRPHADLQNIIGMFVNTLAMRNHPAGQKKFKDFLGEVKQNSMNAFENQDYQFDNLVEKLEIRRDASRNPVFDVMFGMQNMGKFEFNIPNLKFTNYPMKSRIAKFDLTLTAEENENGIEFELEYSSRLFKRDTVERMGEHYINILSQIVKNYEIKLSEINLISKEESNFIVNRFNNSTSQYPRHKTLKELFEYQVEKTPDNVALVFGNKQLTYKQLNNKANQIARVLRNKGIKANSVVGMMSVRSIEMIIGIFAILKAGGAYLPIDPEYPEERIKYMIDDSKTKILLTHKHIVLSNDLNCEILYLDDENIYDKDLSNLDTINESKDLAYLMYTSGSTGKPKGNLTTHYNISRVVKNTNYINITESDVILQLSNYAFDGSTFDIFGALLNGSKLVLIEKDMIQDIEKLSNVIINQKISIFFVTTALFNALADLQIECFQNIRKVLFGGERVSVSHVRKALEYMGKDKIFHVYGPTESTVFATYYPVNEIEKNPITIPIGRPLANTKIYIMDKNMNLQPVGIPGELCISGDGIVKGYLNRPELDAEKFVPGPFNKGQIMYKTGDLARLTNDGNIEFIDRMDNQVKIRGFRIELGEIEIQLLKHNKIKEAMVVAREDKPGSKYLCAYIKVDKELTASEIRDYLSKELPNYMIPAYYVQLDKLPLNASGKVDQKALPEPGATSSTIVGYAEPRNKIEEKMLQIWKQVLGSHDIGINDDFFDNGGDSIKATQIVSKLRKENLSIEVKQLFQYSEIRELSKFVKVDSKIIDQGIVTGEIGLTPIQKWFFEKRFTDMHHFNQAVMLYSENGFDEDIIGLSFKKIVEHHDVLRMVYKIEDNSIVQENRAIEGNLFELNVVDLRNDYQYITKIEKIVYEIQAGLNLQTGPIVRLGLFKTSEGDHLIIVIHHLVIDGVSWRILLEDLASMYQQICKGYENIKIQNKTHSFKEWCKNLYKYSNSQELLNEIPYWENIESANIKPLKKDYEINKNRIKDSKTLSVNLSKIETENLLKKVNNAYETEITEILLAALAMSVNQWTEEEKILLNLEGHGREDLGNGMDVTRTIGWFTSAFPVLLNIHNANNIGEIIQSVKSNIRNIPKKGVGYGILKYITLPENRESIRFNLKPEISFNYLGQFDQDFKTDVFEVSSLSTGDSISQNCERLYTLDINGVVINGELTVSINYNKNEYNKSQIAAFIDSYKGNLLEIVNHCIEIGESQNNRLLKVNDNTKYGQQQGDISLVSKIFVEETSKFEKEFLDNVTRGKLVKQYSVSGTQKYHLIDPELAGVIIYFKKAVDMEILKRSLLYLINTHELLRSIIVNENGYIQWKEFECPQNISIPFMDLSKYNLVSQTNIINHLMSNYYFYRQYEKYGVLHYRLVLIKQTVDEYVLLMPFNHTIFDATSSELIKRNLLENYEAFKNNKQIPIKQLKCHSDYIKQVRKGPQKINEEQLIKTFDLEEAEVYLEKINKIIKEKKKGEGVTWFDFEIPMENIQEDIDINRPWQISFALLTAFCREFLDTAKIPMRMVSNGRRMGNNTYYNNVGDFADHIPMLINSQELNPLVLAQYVQDKINTAAKHNINFADIVFDEEIKKNYETAYGYIKNQMFNSPVLFNYQGKFEDEEIEAFNKLLIGNNFDDYKKMIKEKGWVAFFVKYSVNAIKIIVALPFKVDEKYLFDFLNNQTKEIIGRIDVE